MVRKVVNVLKKARKNLNNTTTSIMMRTRKIKDISICLVVVFTLSLCFGLSLGFAQDIPGETGKPPAQDLSVNEGEAAPIFNYQLEGRPDPFVPFIEPKIATKIDPNEIIDDDEILTGMQLFEPGQLTLVAIMFAEGTKMAMVEDVTGKGDVINEGIPVGRRGVVSEIAQNQVIITEKARTRAGKELITTFVMRLNKEGDQ